MIGRVNGVKVAAIAIQGFSSITICSQAWNYLLQAVVGAEQAVHSRATNSGEMQPVIKAVVLYPPN